MTAIKDDSDSAPNEEDTTEAKRKQTDESLKIERGESEDTSKVDVSDIDESADEVINRGRARSDEEIAAARATADRDAEKKAASPVAETEREQSDKVLKKERAEADKAIRGARAENIALLAKDREKTDKDLSGERDAADGALKSRDEFLGIVSHDLLNMLSGVMGFAALIEAKVSQENHVEDVLEYARKIRRSGDRMNRLIADLVDVASLEAGKLAVVREVNDPAKVVTEALETFQAKAAESGITLVDEIVPPLPQTAFDPERILQVFSNLLGNALKFTPSHGKVFVHVEHIGREIKFEVRDTGMGIPDDKLESVFERFIQVEQSDRRGLGLGLYISKSIIEAHDGKIWAESKIGEGSKFCFTLPIQSQIGKAKSFVTALMSPSKG